SEPYQITPPVTAGAGGVQLDRAGVFSCEAVSLRFQLGVR
ncbi:hypothetical protein Q6270_26800, partial [Klebsiella pneumoniae]|nr:hypothetical protein [Klebsiella pneumoniae]